MIQIQEVTFSYPTQTDQPVLNHLSLNLSLDQCTGLSGSNGTGKTTLSLLLIGLIRPNHGRILLNGQCLSDMTLHELGKQIGYLFQNPRQQLFADTVIDELLFPFTLQKRDTRLVREHAEKLMGVFHLKQKKYANPLTLSTGEQKRLALAAVMMNNPDYLILDEPTNGLDQESREVLDLLISERKMMKKGILMISHDLSFINRHCQTILCMNKREIQEVCRAT